MSTRFFCDFLQLYRTSKIAGGRASDIGRWSDLINQFLWNALRGKRMLLMNPGMKKKYREFTKEDLKTCSYLALTEDGLAMLAEKDMKNIFPGSPAVHPRNEIFVYDSFDRDRIWHVQFIVDVNQCRNATLIQCGGILGDQQEKLPLIMVDTHHGNLNIRSRTFGKEGFGEALGELNRDPVVSDFILSSTVNIEIWMDAAAHSFHVRIQHRAKKNHPWKTVERHIHIEGLSEKFSGRDLHVKFGQYLTNQILVDQTLYVHSILIESEDGIVERKKEELLVEDQMCMDCMKHIKKRARLVYFL